MKSVQADPKKEDWSPEGEIPDRFFPDEDDEAEVPA